MAELSTGCLECIMAGAGYDKPILQILKKEISDTDTNERHQFVVSDGKYLINFAMLATQQLNVFCTQGDLVESTIIQVDRYNTSIINKSGERDKHVLIILEWTVLHHGSEVREKVGSPVLYTGDSSCSGEPPVANNLGSINNDTNSGSTLAEMPPPSTSYNTNSYSHNSSVLSQPIDHSKTHPIASLSPFQNKIKARVVSKSAIRTWRNAKGEGKLFDMYLRTESGKVRATVFNELCDKFYDKIDVNQVYVFSNWQETYFKGNCELNFTKDTEVESSRECSLLIPISKIANMEPDAVVDIIGVCCEIGELEDVKKRDLTLVDSSNESIQVSLWSKNAINFKGHGQPIVLIHGGKVREFGGGKSISVGAASVVQINPNTPEGHKLREWFNNHGSEDISNSVSARTGGMDGSRNTDRGFQPSQPEPSSANPSPGTSSASSPQSGKKRKSSSSK